MWSALLINSLLVAAGTTVAAGLASLLAALWAAAGGATVRKWLIVGAIVSFAMPPFVQANCWLDLLGANGWLRSLIPFNVYSKGGAVALLTLLSWPIFFGFGLAAWSRIEASQIEADPALRGFPLIRWLLWPMVRAATAQGALLVFVLALNNFAVPALLQVRVLPAQVWIQFDTKLDPLAAFAAAWPLIAAPLLLLFFWRKGEWSFPISSSVTTRALRRQLGLPLLSVSGSVTFVLLLLSLLFPASQLLGSARTWSELVKVTLAVTDVLRNTFLTPAFAAFVCLVIGLLTSRWRFGWLLWLTFFMPGVLLGIAFVTLFNRAGLDFFYRSLGIIVLAWSVRYVALSWQGANYALASVAPELLDDARLCGARGWPLFWHVQLPQIAPKLALTWYLTYLLCLWDVETILLILPPGGETLAVRVFGLLHYGHNSQVNALCLLLLGLAIAPLLVWRCLKFFTGIAAK